VITKGFNDPAFSVMWAYIVKQQNIFRNSPGWMSSPGSPLKLCTLNRAAMMHGSAWCLAVSLGWAGCCVSLGWGSSSGSSRSSNGESDSGSESVSELLEEGIEIPVDDRVMVASLSWGTNLLFSHGWFFVSNP
jgi:hypothetical protein